MINIINLDDFVKMGGTYSPVRLIKKHLWGWECEYMIQHPSVEPNPFTVTVGMYKYGGRFILSDKHFDDNIGFFEKLNLIYKSYQDTHRPARYEGYAAFGKLVCSLLILGIKLFLPVYSLISIFAVVLKGDYSSIWYRLTYIILSLVLVRLLSEIKVWLMGVGSLDNASDFEILMRGGAVDEKEAS